MFIFVIGFRVFFNMVRLNCVVCSSLIYSCIGDLLFLVVSGW